MRTCWVTAMFALTIVQAGGQTAKGDRELQMLADHVFYLSEVMLHDVTNPPAASRVYSYAMLGAYEVAFMAKGQRPHINSKLVAPPQFAVIAPPRDVDVSFCSNFAMLEVGKALMPSGYRLEERQKELTSKTRKARNWSESEVAVQVKFARDVASQVITYARADGYSKLSTYTRYTPKKGDEYWYPTPPAYMAAVEPHWETIRPFFLDSAAQFSPVPAAPFSRDPSSSFYKQMMEVYEIGNALTQEQKNIANFWDCNPFAVSFSGHVAFGQKKISPGGHWMGITGIVCKQLGIPLDSAITVHTAVAMALHDAFISCWSEKYRSERIRPETAINKYVDPDWRPLLQTPPFPEYSSGHSVVSSAAAVVLTHFLGDNVRFLDTSEVYFGLPAREFNSFLEASNEAAISRLYGGIHYRDACERGVVQGRNIGQNVVNGIHGLQP